MKSERGDKTEDECGICGDLGEEGIEEMDEIGDSEVIKGEIGIGEITEEEI
jgi:hypothetical protein